MNIQASTRDLAGVVQTIPNIKLNYLEMQIHFFTKYTPSGASSRYRSYQYHPLLKSAGWQVTVFPLFDDTYLTHKYARGRSRLLDVARAFARRVRDVLRMPHGAVVLIEYELLPYFPALLERWLAWRGCCMMVDYDDALFHQYDQHPNWWVRSLLGDKIAAVMRQSKAVVAGNEYLADFARRAGARRVEVIPTVVDLSLYVLEPAAKEDEIFTIGWVGSPSTASYLHDLAQPLAQVCRAVRTRVRLVGSGQVELSGLPVELIAWSEAMEVATIGGFDVGIMPLPDELWARGKCGFKLIQYMACSLPVVASPVGVNCQIVEHGVNGFLAETPEQWDEALRTLAADPVLRARMGQAGRLKVEQQFSLHVTGPMLVEFIKCTVSS
jgi:glycosyltransferase involved in cell wall biosynthesis